MVDCHSSSTLLTRVHGFHCVLKPDTPFHHWRSPWAALRWLNRAMGPVQRIKRTCNSRTKNNILISSRKIESDNKWNVLSTLYICSEVECSMDRRLSTLYICSDVECSKDGALSTLYICSEVECSKDKPLSTLYICSEVECSKDGRCQHFTYAQKWNVLRTERCRHCAYAQKWNVLRTDRCQHCTYAQKWNVLRTDAVNTWHMLRSGMSTTNANAHHKVYYYIFYMASV